MTKEIETVQAGLFTGHAEHERIKPSNEAMRHMAAERKAFKGFTGDLDAVQEGDFQEALRLLRRAADGYTRAEWRPKAAELLKRLQPESGS